MKIIDKINNNDLFYSFEYYPPKTIMGQQSLYLKMLRMVNFEPSFIDITWGAGGSTSDLTLDICINTQKNICIETQMHLTCSNMNEESIIKILDIAKKNNIQNILALRGDEPKNNKINLDQKFKYAIDLVRFIRERYGEYFGISVAGYPEGHPDSVNYQQDLIYLKEKVDAGADFIITQFFYNVDLFLKFVNDCRKIGITCPIIPGILPIYNYRNFKRMVGFCCVNVPPKILEDLEQIKNDDMKVSEYGIKLCIEMCKKLIDNNVKLLHLYTLNREDCIKKILEGLDLIKNVPLKRELPWRPQIGTKEDVRPIFWSNTSDNYINRTSEWEEFPNGRWGDLYSSTFGEINDYHLFTVNLGTDKNKKKMWGHEISIEQIRTVFIKFLNKEIKYIPWCDNLAYETEIIKDELIKLNKLNYLTINSQPRLNGVSSDWIDGWGGPGGYLYQKAYLEFFTTKENLDKLIEKIGNNINYSYCAINVNDDIITNCSNTINAITWGIFANRQIVQPSVADTNSFKIWKKDAFNLWLNEWANIYDEESSSYSLLKHIHDTYYLVFIVDNDYINGNIWELFKFL